MFPDRPLSEIPVRIQRESFDKFTNALRQCTQSNQEDTVGVNQSDVQSTASDVEMALNPTNDAVDKDREDVDAMNVDSNRKRKSPEMVTSDPLSAVPSSSSSRDRDDGKSPRKKRKISSHSAVDMDDKYGPSHLCPDQEFLSHDQKSAVYSAFEHTPLIESVWRLSRFAVITAFINMELDLPTMSGLQTVGYILQGVSVQNVAHSLFECVFVWCSVYGVVAERAASIPRVTR